MATVKHILTKTFTFNSSLEDWVVSSAITRITTDGSPDLGCLYANAAGRNDTISPSISWNGTYSSLGVPADATIISLTGHLYFKQDITGTVNDAYWDLWYNTNNSLVTSPNNFNTLAWHNLDGPLVSGLSILPTANLNLLLNGYMRCGNDKTAVIDMFWDTIAIDIEYEVPFAPPVITTNAASNLDTNSATLNGSVSSLGDATSIDVFFQYRQTGETVWIDTAKQLVSTVPSSNTANITSLISGTDYEYRFVGEYEAGVIETVLGDIVAFTTVSDTFQLTVEVVGNGTTVPTAGVHDYFDGTIVSLTATAGEGSHFSKWFIDGADILTASSEVTMTTNKTVVAYFGDYKELQTFSENVSEDYSDLIIAKFIALASIIENTSETLSDIQLLKIINFLGTSESASETDSIINLTLAFMGISETASETSLEIILAKYLALSGFIEQSSETLSTISGSMSFSGISENQFETLSDLTFKIVTTVMRFNSIKQYLLAGIFEEGFPTKQLTKIGNLNIDEIDETIYEYLEGEEL